MPEFLILKLEGDSPRSAQIVAHVISDAEPSEAIAQGYVGDGRYAIVDWDERVECDLRPGAVEAADVEDKAARAALAEAAEEEPAVEEEVAR